MHLARITFQKRQKEMKRQEKQRMKAEKRAQRKLQKNAPAEGESSAEVLNIASDDPDLPSDAVPGPSLAD